MAIRIIQDDERLELTIEGATFIYRRIPAGQRAKIVEQCTGKRSGQINWGKATIAIMEYCLFDWRNVIDAESREVTFDKALISYIPDTAQSELMEAFGANAEALEGDIKNLPTTPSSNRLIEG